MSMAALLQGVEYQLKKSIPNLNNREIEIMDNGQPPPVCGERFIAVHALGKTPGDTREIMMAVDQVFSVGVTITQRCAVKPVDRRSSLYLKQWSGIEALETLILNALHQNWDATMEQANQLIQDENPTARLFIEPLRWQGSDAQPRIVDGSWFYAVPDESVGLVYQITFWGARRLQVTGSIT